MKEIKIFTYKQSGVDTKKSSKLVKKLELVTKSNFRKEIIKNPGGFSSLFDLKKLRYKDPILISSTDGVGTKLKIAIEHKKLSYLGFDLVGMCVNDILTNGGEPLFFLDYISSSKIKEKEFLELISSINKACGEAGCSLVGGETAEMPGMYNNNEFDIAGFSVGVVERKHLLGKQKVKKDSLIIGLESSGFHSNGFSLIRKIIEEKSISLKKKAPYKTESLSLGDDLLKPTKIYVNLLLPLIKKKKISAISHITGGGIFENLERVLPENISAIIDFKEFSIPENFLWIQDAGKINTLEMLKTFNCGFGLLLIIENKNKKEVLNYLKKKKVKFHLMGRTSSATKLKKVVIKKFGKWDLT